MNQLIINGVQRPAPEGDEQRFKDLLSYAQRNFSGPAALLSQVRVNGIEVSDSEQEAIQNVSLSHFDSVEIVFSHPREIAEETLQTLREFLPGLIALCSGQKTPGRMKRLFDGIQILTEAVSTAKSILQVGPLEVLDCLEAELSRTLQSILEANEAQNSAEQSRLIEESLAGNLERWRIEGIPLLIRLRDS